MLGYIGIYILGLFTGIGMMALFIANGNNDDDNFYDNGGIA